MTTQNLTSIPSNGDYSYTSVLLHNWEPILFAGRDDGCVEVWDLSEMVKRAELRYLVVNEFGEQEPIEDPVVSLDAPESFHLVYAFIGSAAYCIDVEYLTIIEKIPISEEVVSGSISPHQGKISVATEYGYISHWSPRFIERVGSLDFKFPIRDSYITHHWDESKIILVFSNNKVLLAAFEDEPYYIHFKTEKFSILAEGITADVNDNWAIQITDEGILCSHDRSIIKHPLLNEGKEIVDNKIREFIADQEITEEMKEYVVDFRFERLSRDRYIAEISHMGKSTHETVTSERDNTTLYYAVEDYLTAPIERRAEALSLIKKVCKRNDITVNHLLRAYRRGADQNQLIEQARRYDFTAYHRQQSIKRFGIFSIILTSVLIFLAELITFNFKTVSLYLVPVCINLLILYLWHTKNENPELSSVREYTGIKLVLLFANLVALGLMIWNSFPVVRDWVFSILN